MVVAREAVGVGVGLGVAVLNGALIIAVVFNIGVHVFVRAMFGGGGRSRVGQTGGERGRKEERFFT